MDFEEFRDLCDRLSSRRDDNLSEADTIGKLVLPFLEGMGYSEDDFERESPTFAGRIDIAVRNGKERLIAVEAKANGKKLNATHEGQLKAYMCTSGMDFGILSNGSEFRFFIRTAKGESGIASVLGLDTREPTVTAWMLFSMLSKGKATKNKIAAFRTVSDDLAAILTGFPTERTKIVTTDDEMAAFNFIRGMLSSEFDVSRLSPNDTVNYFSVIVDGMKKRTLCRIRFDRDPHVLQFYERDENGNKRRDAKGLPTVFRNLPFGGIHEIAAYRSDFIAELRLMGSCDTN